MDAQFEHTALEIEEKMNSVGMTISQLIHFYSVRKSTLFNLSTEQYRQFSYFYQLLVSQDYSKFTKGSLLERISTILFQNSLFMFAIIVGHIRMSSIYLSNGVIRLVSL